MEQTYKRVMSETGITDTSIEEMRLLDTLYIIHEQKDVFEFIDNHPYIAPRNRSGGTCASGSAGAAGPRKTFCSTGFGGKAAKTGRTEETPGGALPLPTTLPERLLAPLLFELHEVVNTIFSGSKISLEIRSDPDESTPDILTAYIVSRFEPDDTLRLLEEFDQHWWLDNAHRALDSLTVNFSYLMIRQSFRSTSFTLPYTDELVA